MSPTAAQPETRSNVSAIQDRPHAQVLIIGGGINGISTFRDLALQGVDVVLVERSDYCSGASAASSHMIHGGIRYLENGEFRLVQESVHERNGLLKIAPHYVKPLETTVPIFSTFSGVMSAPLRFLTHKQGKYKERGALLIKTGLTIYDVFSRDGGTVPRHHFHGRKKSLANLPQINPNIEYTATYYDASIHDPERLALDVLHDGLATGNARAANYVEAVGFEDGGVKLRDLVTGAEFSVKADVVVNASGPWTDLTNDELGYDTSYMGGTKGSHIVVDNPELFAATGGTEIFFEHSDGRIVLIHPFKGKVLIGSTDTDADPREVAVCTDEEVDYFLSMIPHVFPNIPVDRSQIVYRYSGIRPLPKHDDTQPGFVSRDYRIVPTEIPGGTLLSLVGGKWTTFRALGEQLSDEVLALLKVERTVSTAALPIGGGKDFPKTQTERTVWIAAHADGVSAAHADALLNRYGTKAAQVIEASVAEHDESLRTLPGYSRAEIEHLARTESVVHLADVIFRRTSLAITGQANDAAVIGELSQIVAGTLGWSEERRAQEVRDVIAELHDRHGMTVTGEAEAEVASSR